MTQKNRPVSNLHFWKTGNSYHRRFARPYSWAAATSDSFAASHPDHCSTCHPILDFFSSNPIDHHMGHIRLSPSKDLFEGYTLETWNLDEIRFSNFLVQKAFSLPDLVTHPNSLITYGWGFSVFITSSSDNKSFLSDSRASPENSTVNGLLQYSVSILTQPFKTNKPFRHNDYNDGNGVICPWEWCMLQPTTSVTQPP